MRHVVKLATGGEIAWCGDDSIPEDTLRALTEVGEAVARLMDECSCPSVEHLTSCPLSPHSA